MRHTFQLLITVETDEIDYIRARDAFIRSLKEDLPQDGLVGWVHPQHEISEPDEADAIMLVDVTHADEPDWRP